jgi:hypothetical protein
LGNNQALSRERSEVLCYEGDYAKKIVEQARRQIFEQGHENKLYLKRKFFCFRYVESTSMPKYLNNLNKILVDLQNLEV